MRIGRRDALKFGLPCGLTYLENVMARQDEQEYMKEERGSHCFDALMKLYFVASRDRRMTTVNTRKQLLVLI